MKHSSRITPGGDPDNDGKTTAAAAPEDGGEFAIDPLRMHHLVRNLYSSSLMLGQGFNREGCFVIDTGSVDFLNFFKKNAVNTGETHPQLSQNPTLYEMPLKEAVKVAYREPLTWGHQDSSVARGRQESSVGSIATAVSLNSNPEKPETARSKTASVPSPNPRSPRKQSPSRSQKGARTSSTAISLARKRGIDLVKNVTSYTQKMRDKRARFIEARRKNFQLEKAGSANRIDEGGYLPLWMKIAYCAPTMSTLPVVTVLAVYGNSFYEQLGADLVYMSFFIALARSLDVMSDPVMSYITDSFRSVYGRRRPFCIIGCVFYALFLILLLSPPEAEGTTLSLWFGILYVLFFLSSTFTTIPYDALGPELTSSYEDRNRLFFISSLFDGFGALFGIALPQILARIIGSDCDNSSCQPVPDGALGDSPYSYMATACVANAGDGHLEEYNLSLSAAPTPAPVGAGTAAPTPSLFGLYDFTEDACQALDETVDADMSPIDPYCDCLDDCNVQCELRTYKQAMTGMAVFFGLYFVVTMTNMFFRIKERSQCEDAKLKESPPLVPSLLNTLRNRAFRTLLPAWVCDAVVNSIIASMVVFFVRYIVRPEYQTAEEDGIDCNEGVPISGEDSESWQCNSTSVVAMCVLTLLVMGFVSTPFWLTVAKYAGKRNAWLMWSLTMACTNLIYATVSKGDVALVIFVSGLNGVPFGAKFLADSILADIIDYDEFLTGQRNEATYTMFRSFLPKICSIPAAAIPLALLDTVGHKAPHDGRIKEQDESVRTYVFIVTVILPFLFSFLAFLIKLGFPIKTREQVGMIGEGIGAHMLGEKGMDPITSMSYQLLHTAKEEQPIVNDLDCFPSASIVAEMLDNGTASLLKMAKRQLIGGVLLFFAFGAAAALAFPLLEVSSLSFVPVFLIIGVGVSLTLLGFAYLRNEAAKRLHANPPDKALLNRVLRHRRKIDHILSADIVTRRISNDVSGKADRITATQRLLTFRSVRMATFEHSARHYLYLEPMAWPSRSFLGFLHQHTPLSIRKFLRIGSGAELSRSLDVHANIYLAFHRILDRMSDKKEQPRSRKLSMFAVGQVVRISRRFSEAPRGTLPKLFSTSGQVLEMQAVRESTDVPGHVCNVRQLLEKIERQGGAAARVELQKYISEFLRMDEYLARCEGSMDKRIGCEVFVSTRMFVEVVKCLGAPDEILSALSSTARGGQLPESLSNSMTFPDGPSFSVRSSEYSNSGEVMSAALSHRFMSNSMDFSQSELTPAVSDLKEDSVDIEGGRVVEVKDNDALLRASSSGKMALLQHSFSSGDDNAGALVKSPVLVKPKPRMLPSLKKEGTASINTASYVSSDTLLDSVAEIPEKEKQTKEV